MITGGEIYVDGPANGGNSAIDVGTEITVTDAKGNVLETITTKKNCNSVILSSDSLQEGVTYTVTAGSQSGEITLEDIYTSNATSRMDGFGKRQVVQ